MAERTWLVLGATGLVGSHCVTALLDRGAEVVAVSGPTGETPASWETACRLVRTVDVRDGDAVGRLVKAVEPDVVLHCAGATAVDRCEAEPAWAAAVNALSVAAVRSALSPHAVLVYLSSDYVFDGAAGPYPETAVPAPLNRYGHTKLVGERLAALHDNHLVVRTTVVYGREVRRPGTGSLAQLLRAAQAKAAFSAPVDEVGTPTHAGRLAADLVELVERGGRGTFHLAGGDLVSRYEYARAAARWLGVDPELVVGVRRADLPGRVRRPARHGLLCQRAETVLGRHMGRLEEGLARAVADLRDPVAVP